MLGLYIRISLALYSGNLECTVCELVADYGNQIIIKKEVKIMPRIRFLSAQRITRLRHEPVMSAGIWGVGNRPWTTQQPDSYTWPNFRQEIQWSLAHTKRRARSDMASQGRWHTGRLNRWHMASFKRAMCHRPWAQTSWAMGFASSKAKELEDERPQLRAS